MGYKDAFAGYFICCGVYPERRVRKFKDVFAHLRSPVRFTLYFKLQKFTLGGRSFAHGGEPFRINRIVYASAFAQTPF